MDIWLSLLQSVSIVVACATAVYGINAWRRELRGKKEHDLAEEVLSLFYEAEDAIRAIRSPVGFKGEGKTRVHGANETEEESAALDRAYVAIERYRERQEVFNRIKVLRYRFMALFGADKAKPFKDLDTVIRQIFIAADLLGTMYWQPHGNPLQHSTDRESHQKRYEEYWRIFYGSFDATDDIENRVQKIVAEIETICEPILRAKNSPMRRWGAGLRSLGLKKR